MEGNLDAVKTKALIWQPDKKKMPVLNDISVELTKGRFYGILGPNGAGKTSLVRQLLRLQNSSEGEVFLDNIKVGDFKRIDIAKMLSFLPQTINSNVDFSVYDIVAMGREPYRKSFAPLSDEDIVAIDEAIKFTDCEKFKDKSISFISGGERQRVMIARTIAQDTPWVILDEPVSNLDITHQTRLMELLNSLREKKNKTIVAILHDINLATAFCTHLILMKNGKVLEEGTVHELLNEDNLKKLYDMDFDFIDVEGRKHPYVIPRYNK